MIEIKSCGKIEKDNEFEIEMPIQCEVRSMKDYTSKELIEKNDYLQETYYGKEMLNDLEKQLKKNKSLQKTLSDKEKKEALLKMAKYYIDLLSE